MNTKRKDIFVEGKPLAEYLGEQEDQVKTQEAIIEKRYTEKVPLYKKPIRTKPKQESHNGPITLFSRRQVMKENLATEINNTNVIAAKVIGLLMLGPGGSAKEIAKQLPRYGVPEPIRLASVTSVLSYCPEAFKDELQLTVHPNRQGGRVYNWIGAPYSLKEAYRRYKNVVAQRSQTGKGNTHQAFKNPAGVKNEAKDEAAASTPEGVDIAHACAQELTATYKTFGGLGELLRECMEQGHFVHIDITIDPRRAEGE